VRQAVVEVSPDDVKAFLGSTKFLPDDIWERDEVGMAHGLAWTAYGGEVLNIEAQVMAGKGNLILTGQLGDVMKESAQAALSYARAKALALGLGVDGKGDYFSEREIHIHVPAGGVPKDGPSAGITIASVLASLVSGIPVRRDVAMTGELTLRGRVLPIGGLKEKLLAAVRNGMKTAIIPAGNAQDLDELPDHLRKKIRVYPVKTMDEVLSLALKRQLPGLPTVDRTAVSAPRAPRKSASAAKPVKSTRAKSTSSKDRKTNQGERRSRANAARRASGRLGPS
jgi:ATP-dependent Lon protease